MRNQFITPVQSNVFFFRFCSAFIRIFFSRIMQKRTGQITTKLGGHMWSGKKPFNSGMDLDQ